MTAAAALALSAGLVAASSPSRAATADAITIGLFLPSKGSAAATARHVRAGAETAIARANRDGGVLGRPLRLASAASDLSWDAASGALVDLVYGQRAVAVVGALDARSGHLAEQIVARARGEAVFLTPWASEPGLTQIRIPWFFRVAPDDDQQAAALAGEIFSVRRIGRVAAWVGRSPDARAAARAFVRAGPPGGVAPFGAEEPEGIEKLLAGARGGEFGAAVLYASPLEAADLASRIRSTNSEILLAGPLWLTADEFVRRGGAVEGAALVTPCPGDAEAGLTAPAALYGHDAVRAVVAALRLAGRRPGAAGLAEALLEIRARGLTGDLQFDGTGQRLGGACLSVLRGDRLEPLFPAAAFSGRSRP